LLLASSPTGALFALRCAAAAAAQVLRSDADGLQLSLGFFEEIRVPADRDPLCIPPDLTAGDIRGFFLTLPKV